MINWEEQALEYLKEYGNDGNPIHEWVDGLVPIYYYDIMQEALRLELFHITIESSRLGKKIWEIFQGGIYDIYHELFMQAYFEQLEFM